MRYVKISIFNQVLNILHPTLLSRFIVPSNMTLQYMIAKTWPFCSLALQYVVTFLTVFIETGYNRVQWLAGYGYNMSYTLFVAIKQIHGRQPL